MNSESPPQTVRRAGYDRVANAVHAESHGVVIQVSQTIIALLPENRSIGCGVFDCVIVGLRSLTVGNARNQNVVIVIHGKRTSTVEILQWAAVALLPQKRAVACRIFGGVEVRLRGPGHGRSGYNDVAATINSYGVG